MGIIIKKMNKTLGTVKDLIEGGKLRIGNVFVIEYCGEDHLVMIYSPVGVKKEDWKMLSLGSPTSVWENLQNVTLKVKSILDDGDTLMYTTPEKGYFNG
jgi:hypothetical protein